MFFRQPGVADQAVRPKVDDLDFQVIRAGLHGPADLHSPGRGPDYAEIVPVQTDAGEVLHNAQVKEPGGPQSLRLGRG